MFDLGDETMGSSFTMAVSEQPPQRLENFGVNAVSDTELLAMILQGNGIRADQALGLASRLIGEAGSLAGLISWSAADYRRMKGIGRIKGLQLGAIAEIARRMMTAQRPTPPMLNRADLIAAHFATTVAGLQVEKFWVLRLNRKQRLLKQVEVTSGTATAALAHPREVYRAAINRAAPVWLWASDYRFSGKSMLFRGDVGRFTQ
ncbi:MAG: JAB domain-containing protein [Opitutaceae bacterium]|nr:JAB domain-containing protein [Opitutaceae bacterium]